MKNMKKHDTAQIRSSKIKNIKKLNNKRGLDNLMGLKIQKLYNYFMIELKVNFVYWTHYAKIATFLTRIPLKILKE